MVAYRRWFGGVMAKACLVSGSRVKLTLLAVIVFVPNWIGSGDLDRRRWSVVAQNSPNR